MDILNEKDFLELGKRYGITLIPLRKTGYDRRRFSLDVHNEETFFGYANECNITIVFYLYEYERVDSYIDVDNKISEKVKGKELTQEQQSNYDRLMKQTKDLKDIHKPKKLQLYGIADHYTIRRDFENRWLDKLAKEENYITAYDVEHSLKD
ncbi:hypothetical protein [Breznakia pachnodae]|uniref:Uncharacterized protein n=1 Tax=Breznakia pachnodae TaxID=265178 RepID=A0ABU0E436_9FIRM|nr:hypothetical protein [Breznakia pachnodae]MDQ0361645.1 hypothetical protein [Breznakia pachnodae]